MTDTPTPSPVDAATIEKAYAAVVSTEGPEEHDCTKDDPSTCIIGAECNEWWNQRLRTQLELAAPILAAPLVAKIERDRENHAVEIERMRDNVTMAELRFISGLHKRLTFLPSEDGTHSIWLDDARVVGRVPAPQPLTEKLAALTQERDALRTALTIISMEYRPMVTCREIARAALATPPVPVEE